MFGHSNTVMPYWHFTGIDWFLHTNQMWEKNGLTSLTVKICIFSQ